MLARTRAELPVEEPRPHLVDSSWCHLIIWLFASASTLFAPLHSSFSAFMLPPSLPPSPDLGIQRPASQPVIFSWPWMARQPRRRRLPLSWTRLRHPTRTAPFPHRPSPVAHFVQPGFR